MDPNDPILDLDAKQKPINWLARISLSLFFVGLAGLFFLLFGSLAGYEHTLLRLELGIFGLGMVTGWQGLRPPAEHQMARSALIANAVFMALMVFVLFVA
jgi:hypothetical protein